MYQIYLTKQCMIGSYVYQHSLHAAFQAAEHLAALTSTGYTLCTSVIRTVQLITCSNKQLSMVISVYIGLSCWISLCKLHPCVNAIINVCLIEAHLLLQMGPALLPVFFLARILVRITTVIACHTFSCSLSSSSALIACDTGSILCSTRLSWAPLDLCIKELTSVFPTTEFLTRTLFHESNVYLLRAVSL